MRWRKKNLYSSPTSLIMCSAVISFPAISFLQPLHVTLFTLSFPIAVPAPKQQITKSPPDSYLPPTPFHTIFSHPSITTTFDSPCNGADLFPHLRSGACLRVKLPLHGSNNQLVRTRRPFTIAISCKHPSAGSPQTLLLDGAWFAYACSLSVCTEA